MTGERDNTILDLAVLTEQLDDVHLDALGLLDEHEQIAFRQWLDQVPEEVRQSLIAEQARLSASAPGIDGVSPPVELRARVIRAVLEAVRHDALQGSGQVAKQESRDTSRSPNHAPHASVEHGSHAARSRRVARHRGGTRVHRWWRTVAIGASVATLGMLVVHTQLTSAYRDVSRLQSLEGLINAFGADHLREMLFNESVVRVSLRATDPNSKVEASIWINPDRNHGLLVISHAGLATANLRVVALDDEDQPIGDPLVDFRSTGVMQTVAFTFDREMSGRIGVVAVQPDGTELLLAGALAA